MLSDALLQVRPLPGEPGAFPAEHRESQSQDGCPFSLLKPALICPGELTCSRESTESIPNLWGPLVFVSSPHSYQDGPVDFHHVQWVIICHSHYLFLCPSCPDVASGPSAWLSSLWRCPHHPLSTDGFFRHKMVRLLLHFPCPALESAHTGVFRFQVWALRVLLITL